MGETCPGARVDLCMSFEILAGSEQLWYVLPDCDPLEHAWNLETLPQVDSTACKPVG